ncbi:MAG: outer membrane protein assembly factor BamB family protein [Thermoguttaceae bacterium]
MIRRTTRLFVPAFAVLLVAPLVIAAEGPVAAPVPSVSPDWPQWRGPARDGISQEKGLLQSWPDGGPKLRWTLTGIGRGYASPIVVGETIYVTGDGEENLGISAVSLDGKLRWRVDNGQVWVRPHPGARSACCYDDGKLYHMNAHGRLACLDGADGKELWAVNVLERFEARNITWGISESVLVDGELVFVTPAGAKGLVAALDKKTGQTVWAAEPLADEQASYASPVLIALGDRYILANSVSKHSFAVDAGSGEVLWCVRNPDPDTTIASTPVLAGGAVVLTNASRNFGAVFSVGLGAQSGRQPWSTELKVSHGGLVAVGETLYGSSSAGSIKGWAAIEAATGRAAALNDQPIGSLAFADNRLYCLTELGRMSLQVPEKGGTTEVGSFQLVDAKDVWAHPVICKGNLFLRYHDTLYCYDIQR